jgi:predicted RNase H-like nuclease
VNVKSGLNLKGRVIQSIVQPLRDRYLSTSDFFYGIKEEFLRNEVEEDDIVDAMVLVLGALQSEKKGVKTLPENPERDSEGLQKAIHYV